MTNSDGDANKQEPEPLLAATADVEALKGTGKKPRKVAKTLLFNAPGPDLVEKQKQVEQAVQNLVESAPAAPEPAQKAAGPTPETTDITKQVSATSPESVVAADEKELARHAQKRAARRVAKTLLFNEVNLSDLQAKAAAASAASEVKASRPDLAPQAPVAPDAPVISPVSAVSPVSLEHTPLKPKPKARLKIAKTLMEVELDNFAGESLNPQVSFAPGTSSDSHTASPPGPSLESAPDLGLGANPAQSSIIDFSTEAERVAEIDAEAKAKAASVTVPPTASQSAANVAVGAAPVKKPRQQFVAKTMLDHSILWDTVSKFEAKMEVKVAEQIAERASEPVKFLVPIECKKQALTCAFKWDDPDAKERFRYCSLCKTPVYNFSGLELPEAEELIYQRENKRNATLFKRADGKFMTVDCPVEVKRKHDTILLSVGGVVAVLAALAFMIFMPHPPKPEPQVQVQNVNTTPALGPGENHGTNTSSRARSAANVAADNGAFIVEHGKRVYPSGTAPVNFPAPVQQPAATTDADESGDFWQYDGPPQAQPVPQPTQPVPQQPAANYAPQQVQSQYAQPAVDIAVPKPTTAPGVKPDQ